MPDTEKGRGGGKEREKPHPLLRLSYKLCQPMYFLLLQNNQELSCSYSWVPLCSLVVLWAVGLPCLKRFLIIFMIHFLAGYYVYIETFWQSPNDTALLESAMVPPTSGKPNNMICLQFWYHMYGQHVDTLNLFMKRGQQLPAAPIWTKSGTQGNRWRRGQVAVTSTSKFQVRHLS